MTASSAVSQAWALVAVASAFSQIKCARHVTSVPGRCHTERVGHPRRLRSHSQM